MPTVDEIVVRLRADGRALDADLGRYERRVGSFSRNLERTGRGLNRGLTLPLLAAGVASAKLTLEFDHQFALIGSLVGGSEKQLADYKKKVLEMAPALGKAPAELAKALYFVTSSGFEGAAALRVLEASAKASAAGLGSTAVVADAVTSAVNAYGEETLSATKATDILLAAVREGKTEPEEFAGSIGRVIPIAERLGVSFGEVAGIMAAMSLNGTNANEAVTQISAALATAIKPTKEGAEMLATVGRSYADVRAEIKDKGLLATLKDLDDAFGGNIESLAAVFGNIRALRGLLTLTGASAEKYEAIVREVGAAQGDTAEAFGKMADEDMFKLQQAWAELQKTAIELGAVLVPMLLDVVRAGTDLVEWFDSLDEGTQKAVVTLGIFAAALGPTLSLVGKAGRGVEMLAKAYRILRGATLGAAAAQTALNLAQGGSRAPAARVPGSLGAQLAAGGWRTAAGAAPSAAAATGIGAAGVAAAVVIPAAVLVAATLVTLRSSRVRAELERQAAAVGKKVGVELGQPAAEARRVGKGVMTGEAARDEALRQAIARGEAVAPQIAKLQLELSTADSLAKIRELGREIQALQAFAKLEIDLSDLTEKTPAELDTLVQHVKRSTGLAEETVKKMLDRVAGEKLTYQTPPPKLDATERAFNNIVKVARRTSGDTVRDWTGALEALGPAGGKAGARAAAAMMAKLDKLPPYAAYIAAQIARNLLAGVSSAVSTAQLRLEQTYIRLQHYEAEGGAYLLSGPTSFLAGEAGREVAAFFPLDDRARSAEVFAELQEKLAGVLGSGRAIGGDGVALGGGVPDVYVFIGDEEVAARVELRQRERYRRSLRE